MQVTIEEVVAEVRALGADKAETELKLRIALKRIVELEDALQLAEARAPRDDGGDQKEAT